MAIELGGTQKSPGEARIACETTLKFCKALFALRGQVLETLRSVKEREQVLQVMKARVMNIQNELDIGDSEDEQSRDTRKELTRIGAELVKATRKALEVVQNLLTGTEPTHEVREGRPVRFRRRGLHSHLAQRTL